MSRKEYYEANKEYIKAKSKAWREANADRNREYQRKYHKENAERLSEAKRRYRSSEIGKTVAEKVWRADRERYPEKHKARRQLRKAVERGLILKHPCVVCGDPKSEGHHEDYGKPLEVVWLCRKHHKELHAASGD